MDGGPDSGDTVPKTTSGQIENNDSRCHAFRIFKFFCGYNNISELNIKNLRMSQLFVHQLRGSQE